MKFGSKVRLHPTPLGVYKLTKFHPIQRNIHSSQASFLNKIHGTTFYEFNKRCNLVTAIHYPVSRLFSNNHLLSIFLRVGTYIYITYTEHKCYYAIGVIESDWSFCNSGAWLFIFTFYTFKIVQ